MNASARHAARARDGRLEQGDAVEHPGTVPHLFTQRRRDERVPADRGERAAADVHGVDRRMVERVERDRHVGAVEHVVRGREEREVGVIHEAVGVEIEGAREARAELRVRVGRVGDAPGTVRVAVRRRRACRRDRRWPESCCWG